MRGLGWLVWLSTVSTLLAACRIDLPEYSADDALADAEPVDSTLVDATAPDAMACTPDTTDCDDSVGRYVECGSDGSPILEIRCALGCSPDVEKCLDIDPSNDLAPYLDQARTDPAVGSVAFSGDSTLNTNSGVVFNGPTQIDVPSANAGGIRVFMFKTLSLVGTLKVTGSLPLAIVADGEISVSGLLDVSADGVTAGPGAINSGSQACFGGSNMASALGYEQGGGGGGGFEVGAVGGQSGDLDSGWPGGAPVANTTGVPLEGGCRGGRVFTTTLRGNMHASQGGRGGGAIQLVSSTAIEITGNGKIDASGGGGASTSPANGILLGGGGGGSGGMILLEAPVIAIDGPAVAISTKGGGGAAAGNGSSVAMNGADGGTDGSPAAGGGGTLAHGGLGGTEESAPIPGGAGSGAGTRGGGGGGSAGRARFNSGDGGANPQNGAAVLSPYTNGVVGSRLQPP